MTDKIQLSVSVTLYRSYNFLLIRGPAGLAPFSPLLLFVVYFVPITDSVSYRWVCLQSGTVIAYDRSHQALSPAVCRAHVYIIVRERKVVVPVACYTTAERKKRGEGQRTGKTKGKKGKGQGLKIGRRQGRTCEGRERKQQGKRGKRKEDRKDKERKGISRAEKTATNDFIDPRLFFFQEGRCAYGVLIMATYWLTEALPIPVTSLLPMILFPLLEIVPVKEVAMNYLQVQWVNIIGKNAGGLWIKGPSL